MNTPVATTSDPWKPSFCTWGRTSPWSGGTFGIQPPNSDTPRPPTPTPVQRFQCLLCCSHGYSKRVFCTSVSLWLHTVKLALSLVYLGIKNIWGMLWLNQSFLFGSMHEPSLFLFLTLCKSTTVVAHICLDVLPTFPLFWLEAALEGADATWPSNTLHHLKPLSFLLHLVTLSLSLWPTNHPQHPPEQSCTPLITFLDSL